MAVISIVVELKDKPGQLLKALEPISKFGGNIIGITHKRDKTTPLGRVPVEISIQLDEKKLKKLINELKSKGIVIRRYNEIRLLATTSILLVGHIIHTDLSDTINKIDQTGFAEVIDMKICMPQISGPSTALVTISAIGKRELQEAIEILKKVCYKKNILVIEPINFEL